MAGLAEGGPRVQTACALTWQDTVGPGGRDGIRLLRGGAETGSRGWSRGAARLQAEGEDVGGKPPHTPNPGTELAARRGGGAPHFALGRGSGNGPRTKRPVSRL